MNIDEDIPMMDKNEIIKSGLNLMKDFHKHGEECFETCSNAQIQSVFKIINDLILPYMSNMK